MVNEAELWEIEQNLWLGDAARFTATMAENCVMVFAPPAGILSGQEIMEGLKGAPRWDNIEMTDRVFSTGPENVVVIAYKALGKRGDEPSYSALCSSTYSGQTGEWKLLCHQQTPVED